MKKDKGFSLLEVVLVLSIIALMMVAGIRLSEQHLMRVKVENTVMQMQSMITFAQQFYGMNKRWPETADMNPTQLSNCPWKHGSIQDPCYTVDGSNNFFSLELNIPATLTNKNVATMIAARLPNAKANNYSVQVYVPIPGLITSSSSSLMKSGYDPNLPTPAGTLTAVFQFYSAGKARDYQDANPPLKLKECADPTNFKEVFFLLPSFNNMATVVSDPSYGPITEIVGTCSGYQNKQTSLCDLPFNELQPTQTPCYLPGIMTGGWPMDNGGLANPTILKPGDDTTIYPYACSIQMQGNSLNNRLFFVHQVAQKITALEYCVPAW